MKTECKCDVCIETMPDFHAMDGYALLSLSMMAARIAINGSTDFSDWEFTCFGRNGRCVHRAKAVLHAIHREVLGFNEEWTTAALTPRMREAKAWVIHLNESSNVPAWEIESFCCEDAAIKWFESCPSSNKKVTTDYSYGGVFDTAKAIGKPFDECFYVQGTEVHHA